MPSTGNKTNEMKLGHNIERYCVMHQ